MNSSRVLDGNPLGDPITRRLPLQIANVSANDGMNSAATTQASRLVMSPASSKLSATPLRYH